MVKYKKGDIIVCIKSTKSRYDAPILMGEEYKISTNWGDNAILIERTPQHENVGDRKRQRVVVTPRRKRSFSRDTLL